MTLSVDWQLAFARQANADLTAYEALQRFKGEAIQECHKLLFLQMACEKLCKSHLISRGSSPESLQSSHAYIAKPLPVVLRERLQKMGANEKSLREVNRRLQQYANEIELLSPSVDRNGQRPDNCEYPWPSGGNVLSPLDQSFAISELRSTPAGRLLLKLIAGAISDLLL